MDANGSTRSRLMLASMAAGVTAMVIGPAVAQPAATGAGLSALPGADRVRQAPPTERNLAVAGSTGYGYTEAVLDDGDSHHRVQGSFAASLTPIEWLALAAKYDLHYDRHSGRSGSDQGIAGHSRYILRAGERLGPEFHLGGETVVWIPAGSTIQMALEAASVDLNILASYLPKARPFALSALAGFRLDNSRKAVGNVNLLSRADRLALIINDNNALLLGAALSWRLAKLELLGEWSWDLAVGGTAPAAFASPMRIVAGARWWLSRVMELQAIAGVSPSRRPSLEPDAPLVTVEPRFWIEATLGLRLPWEMVTSAFSAPPAPKRGSLEGKTVMERGNQPLQIVMKPETATLRGVVRAPSGEPIAGAKIWIGKGEQGVQASTDQQGGFELTDLPQGELELRIFAEGWGEHVQPVRLAPGGTVQLSIELKRPLPEGQVRGQVRGLGERPLAAAIRIEPLGRLVRTDAQGQFVVDVPPGDYQVIVQAPGYYPQTRPARVEHNGVTVLVVDLYRKRQ